MRPAIVLFLLAACGGSQTPEPEAGADLDRSRPPPPGPRPALTVPEVQRAELLNGLTLLVSERHDLPLVTAMVVVRAGHGAVAPAHAGLASFTARALTEGTATRTAEQVAIDSARLGTDLAAGADMDSTTLALSVLVQDLQPALALLADVATTATFPANEVDRVRAEMLADLIAKQDQPSWLASDVFSRALYGEKHPYGQWPDGTQESLGVTVRADLAAFHAREFIARNAAVVLAGDITLAGARPLVEAAFGAWAAGEPAPSVVPKAPSRAHGNVVFVPRDGAAQSQLQVGHVGIARSDPDYHALLVGNEILGGGFASRLNMKLREERGYTYGAGTGFVTYRAPGPFALHTAVRSDATAPALADAFEVIDGYLAGGPTDEEVEHAKSALSLSVTGWFETNASTAGGAAELFVHALPLTSWADDVRRIEALGKGEVLAAMRRHVRPEQMLVVIVGDAETRAAVEALGLGAFELRRPDGDVPDRTGAP